MRFPVLLMVSAEETICDSEYFARATVVLNPVPHTLAVSASEKDFCLENFV